MAEPELSRCYELSVDALDPAARRWVEDEATFYAPRGVDGRKVIFALMGLCVVAPVVYGLYVNELAAYVAMSPGRYGVTGLVLSLAFAAIAVIGWALVTVVRGGG